MSAGAAAAAAAIAQAIKASGVLVRVSQADFESILNRSEKPLVITATGGSYQLTTSTSLATKALHVLHQVSCPTGV